MYPFAMEFELDTKLCNFKRLGIMMSCLALAVISLYFDKLID